MTELHLTFHPHPYRLAIKTPTSITQKSELGFSTKKMSGRVNIFAACVNSTNNAKLLYTLPNLTFPNKFNIPCLDTAWDSLTPACWRATLPLPQTFIPVAIFRKLLEEKYLRTSKIKLIQNLNFLCRQLPKKI